MSDDGIRRWSDLMREAKEALKPENMIHVSSDEMGEAGGHALHLAGGAEFMWELNSELMALRNAERERQAE